MASQQVAALRRTVSGRGLTLLFAAAGSIVVVGRVAGLRKVPAAETFALIFTSILVEALPFVLLGALVSAVIEVYVPENVFARVARLPVACQLPGAALGGLAFPVCECGSVPVARRLIARGMHPSAGLAFMLASPILNPVVLLSTFVAYGPRGLGWHMVAGRAGLGLVLAVVAGWALGERPASALLRARPDDAFDVEGGRASTPDKPRALIEHLAGDFFFMGRFLVAGAALAASLQTVIPQSVVSGVANTPLVGALALIAVAFVLSLCSEADAFVAVSLSQFPLGPQLAFLVFGPVLDTKLAFLYGATFRRGFVARLALVAIAVVVAGSLWFEVVMQT
jgi:uncharacterized membrane protein YraQ (UPF0718 family)